MRCGYCQFENRESVRFCEECGAKLEVICPACGAAIPPAGKFCGGCGQPLAPAATEASKFGSPGSYTPKRLAEKILTSRAALEGERKQVTVLFADLKGSMELLADRDPEEARTILDPVLERMMEAVHRYEGTVNQVEHGLAVFRTGNVVMLLRTTVASSAWVMAQLDEPSEALNRLREGEQLLERFEVGGIVGYCGWASHALGRACLLLGRLDEARSLGERAVESSPHHPGFVAHAQHLLGDIATHPDRFDAESGEAHYRRALALAGPRGMRPLVAHCHLGLGKLYARTGKRQQAQEHLATATTSYRAMDMRYWLTQAEAETRELA